MHPDTLPTDPVHRRIPSYRLHRPSGLAVVTLAGRDHYLGQFKSPAKRIRVDSILESETPEL